MIAVLDYGIGNLRSAQKALLHLGAEAELVTDPAAAAEANGVVLPGVGAFGACAEALRASGLDAVARAAFADRTPFLGICVGYQLMFQSSEESPGVAGLGLFEGSVQRLTGDVKLPQMQWNAVSIDTARNPAMFAGFADPPWFYFVHSYVPVPEGRSADAVAGTCDYGGEIVAAIEDGMCWGTQFHPEKSGAAGLSLLANFVAACA